MSAGGSARQTRRLAAVALVDAVGCSAMISEDEDEEQLGATTGRPRRSALNLARCPPSDGPLAQYADGGFDPPNLRALSNRGCTDESNWARHHPGNPAVDGESKWDS